MKLYHRSQLFALMIGALFSAHSVFAGTGGGFDRENGPLENLQVILLCVGVVLLTVAAPKKVRIERCALLAGAWLCISFIFRELDLEDMNVPQWLIAAGSGTGRNLIIASGWIAIAVYTIRLRADLSLNLLQQMLRSRTAMLLGVSAICMLNSALLDKKVINFESHRLVEEIVETVGYAVFVVALLPKNLTRAVDPGRVS